MSSKTQIGNVALLRIGVTQSVGNVDTETSREAIAIRLIFDDEVDFVLRDFPWPFATAYHTLELVDGSASSPANGDWTFAYRYPSDCMFARRIVTERGRRDATPPPYKIGRDSQGKLIFTDQEDAVLEYTADVTDPQEFDAMFASMLAWRIAANIAPGLSRIEKMSAKAAEMYEIEKTKAQSRSLNEGQQEEPAESEFIRARA
jgi:hypothetical protein